MVPDFVITVTAAPPVIPCSASKLLVEMLTCWMLSDRRDVHRVVRHRHQDVGRTIHAGVVGAALLAVDVRRQRASRRVGDGVLESRRRRAGNQIDQALEVAVAGERQVLDRPRIEVDADVGPGGLQRRRRGFDGDLFVEGADLDGGVDARHGIDRDVDTFLRVRFESAGADREVVRALGQVGDRVVAIVVGRRLARQPGGRVLHASPPALGTTAPLSSVSVPAIEP